MNAPLPVLRRVLADGWRGLAMWAAGIAAVAVLYLPLFPSIRSPELVTLLESLPQELIRAIGYDEVTSGPGYVQATLFGLIGFVLLVIAAIGWGAAHVGGAEEDGTLELTLAHSVGRVRYALEGAAALIVRLVVLGVVAWAVVWAMNEPADLGLDAVDLLAGTIAWASLGLLCATAALAGGALTGRRSWGLGAGAAVAVIGYVLQAIANNNDDLDWLRAVSPYDWAFGSSPVANGFEWGGLAMLWGGSAVLTAIATVALARRDVLG